MALIPALMLNNASLWLYDIT